MDIGDTSNQGSAFYLPEQASVVTDNEREREWLRGNSPDFHVIERGPCPGGGWARLLLLCAQRERSADTRTATLTQQYPGAEQPH